MLDHNGPGHFGSSFALGFSEPNFVEKPTHPHQGRGSWRPNPRMRSQTSSRRTWPSWEGDPWAAQTALGALGDQTPLLLLEVAITRLELQPRLRGSMNGHVSILQLAPVTQNLQGRLRRARLARRVISLVAPPSWQPPGLPEGGASP